MSKPLLDLNTLAQFTGSERFFRHSLVREVVYTEGVRYVLDVAEAYWLLDEIALAQRFERPVMGEPFQVWELTAASGGSGRLTCTDGNENAIYERRFEWTDFPPPGITFYFCNDTLMLPSEY